MWTVGKFNLFIHKHLYFNFLNCNIWFVKVFLPELRILGRIEEAMVVALPLSRDSSAVYVPLAANIKLQPTVNGDYISGITLKQYFWEIWREKKLLNQISSLLSELNASSCHEVMFWWTNYLQTWHSWQECLQQRA